MISRELADRKTMGNSCLIQARKTDKKIPFRAPEWAEKVSVEKLKSRGVDLYNPYENFWYIEIGGNDDTIANAEKTSERLLALCLGIWDTIKIRASLTPTDSSWILSVFCRQNGNRDE